MTKCVSYCPKVVHLILNKAPENIVTDFWKIEVPDVIEGTGREYSEAMRTLTTGLKYGLSEEPLFTLDLPVPIAVVANLAREAKGDALESQMKNGQR